MKANKEIIRITLLLVGAITITFSGLNWHIGITAWIGTLILLWYTRNAKWVQILPFFVAMTIVGAISQTCNNLLNLPAVNIINGLSFGVLYSIPYLADKLIYKKEGKFYYTLVFPASVALIEFMAGFAIGTWGSIAHTQYEFKSLMQLSSVTGIYGIWFIIAWFASSVNRIVENRNKKQVVFKAFLVFGGVLSIIFLFGTIRVNSNIPEEKPVKVAAVLSETNIHKIANQEAKVFKELADDKNVKIPTHLFSDSVSIARLINRTNKAAIEGAKIIVWNEIALVLNQVQKHYLISQIQSVCKRTTVYVLLSFLEECQEKDKKPFNNIAILVSDEGKLVWEYQKSFLHPIAEAPIVNSGTFELPTVQSKYGNLGAVICADLDMQNYIKQAGEKRVDILLVPAFDWAGITPLHSQMAATEAVQFGFNLLRANGMGLSAVYNYKGEELTSVNSLKSNKKILMAEMPFQSTNTIYSQIGNVFIYLCLGFMIFVLVMRFLKPKRN